MQPNNALQPTPPPPCAQQVRLALQAVSRLSLAVRPLGRGVKRVRTVRYKILPPINPFGDPVPHTHGSLVDFLCAMPYLLWRGFIPPLPILNQVLRTGLDDRGMGGGCQWKPFQLEAEEYDELVLELLTWPGKTFYVVESPEQVNTYEEWWRWLLERQVAHPAV